MLEIGKFNLFISDGKGIKTDISINKVLEFYDLEGKNTLLIYKEYSTLATIFKSRKIHRQSGDPLDILTESNLFNIDIVIIEHNIDISNTLNLNIPFIILTTNEKGFNFRNYNRVYKFESEEITDFKTKERFNLKDYYTSLVRDKKIDDLFG
jgi:hypothetical protein